LTMKMQNVCKTLSANETMGTADQNSFAKCHKQQKLPKQNKSVQVLQQPQVSVCCQALQKYAATSDTALAAVYKNKLECHHVKLSQLIHEIVRG